MNEVWQDRIPPQNIEAEQAVLGSVFLDAETIIDAMEYICLLYTSDAADEEDSVDLGGRRIIKKKKNR